MKKVALYLATGFEEIEALSVVDILRRAEVTVDMVSISDSLEVVGGHNIKVIADKVIKDIKVEEYHMMVLPGGMPGTENLDSCDLLKRQIIDFDLDEKYIGAICAAPSIIGKMGFLENKNATCYPGFENNLFHAIYCPDLEVVRSKNIITSRGAGTAMKFGIKLVELLTSKEVATELEKKLLM